MTHHDHATDDRIDLRIRSDDADGRATRPQTPRQSAVRTDGGVMEQVCFPSGECLPVADGPSGEHEQYWDPNESGNPLLDTSGSLREVRVSPHFRVGEFASSGGQRFDRSRIDPLLVRCLEHVRAAVNDRFGGPDSDLGIAVNSGYRSWAYNVELYEDRDRGPTKSEHCSGRGADVRVVGASVSSTDLAAIALESGPPCDTRVGVPAHDDYIHVDVKPRWHASWRGDGIWTYGDRPAGLDDVEAVRHRLDDAHDCG